MLDVHVCVCSVIYLKLIIAGPYFHILVIVFVNQATHKCVADVAFYYRRSLVTYFLQVDQVNT